MTRRDAPVRIRSLGDGWWLWRCWCCRRGDAVEGWARTLRDSLGHLLICRPARRLLRERHHRDEAA